MPIWLRKFTYNKIQKHYEQLNKHNEGDTLMDSTQKFKNEGRVGDPYKVNVPSFIKSQQGKPNKPGIKYSKK